MTAGSVAVPTIIPLRAPQGPKHVINSATHIEIRSGKLTYNLQMCDILILFCSEINTVTSEVVILYAVDGSRPEATFKHGRLNISKNTFIYKSPFMLSPRKVSLVT